MRSWQTISVGVADLDDALRLWVGAFGMQIVAEREGPDHSLAALWSLDPDDIRRQTLLATAGQSVGQLHLVEFVNPEPSIREGAAVFDWVPKNLDIYVENMADRVAELRDAGYQFRTEAFSDVTAPNGIRFREIHMPVHDDINVVLLELVGEEQPLTSKQFGAIGPLITIVPNAAEETAFVADVLGLDELSNNVLEGPEIEAMIGLPAGAALNVSIWGSAALPLGQLEVIEYRGTNGKDLYTRATGKATGIRQIRYAVSDHEGLLQRLSTNGIAVQQSFAVDLIDGAGELISFYSPAGLRIEAIAP